VEKDEIILLKADELGRIECHRRDGVMVIVRDIAAARWWARRFARNAAAREARALERLEGIEGVPRLLRFNGRVLERSFMAGAPMQQAQPRNAAYFRQARRLLASLHRRGVVHNDLAKEPNWLVRDDGTPAMVDFQLAFTRRRRGRLFRLLAREDIRHLLKHKRTYMPELLTRRELHILATPAMHARVWRQTAKRLYKLVARKLFGYWDNEGQGRVRR